jgi:hypothetical protein
MKRGKDFTYPFRIREAKFEKNFYAFSKTKKEKWTEFEI